MLNELVEKLFHADTVNKIRELISNGFGRSCNIEHIKREELEIKIKQHKEKHNQNASDRIDRTILIMQDNDAYFIFDCLGLELKKYTLGPISPDFQERNPGFIALDKYLSKEFSGKTDSGKHEEIKRIVRSLDIDRMVDKAIDQIVDARTVVILTQVFKTFVDAHPGFNLDTERYNHTSNGKFEAFQHGYNLIHMLICPTDEYSDIASVTKSFISALIGIAINEGYIKSLNERILFL